MPKRQLEATHMQSSGGEVCITIQILLPGRTILWVVGLITGVRYATSKLMFNCTGVTVQTVDEPYCM